MKLREWRKKQQAMETMTLPGGLEVVLRRVHILDLVASGRIPETLDALVKKATATGFGVEDVMEFLPLINSVATACLVEPAIGEQADETHVTLDEMPLLDRLAIFEWANGAANALRPFRGEQTGVVEPARAGDDLSQPAERADRG